MLHYLQKLLRHLINLHLSFFLLLKLIFLELDFLFLLFLYLFEVDVDLVPEFLPHEVVLKAELEAEGWVNNE